MSEAQYYRPISLSVAPHQQDSGAPWPSDLTALQSDLNLILDWLSNNLLTMNVDKTKLMIISMQEAPYYSQLQSPYPACVYVNGSPLEVMKCFKYLGVWISDDLSWSLHIESVCSRARRLLGFMYRFFFSSLWFWPFLCCTNPNSPHSRLCLCGLGPSPVQHLALKIIDRSWHADSNNALHFKYGLLP